MTRIGPALLKDTLDLVALARETARLRGDLNKVERLAPVEVTLRNMVTSSQANKPTAANIGVLAQDGFQTLLAASRSQPSNTEQTSATIERHQIVNAMSSSGMADVDIARHMGMTRDEVRLILRVNQPGGVSGTTMEGRQ